MNDRAWRNGEGAAPALDFATLAAMVKDCPFHRWLGVELISLDETGIAIRTPWRAEFVSDPDRGYAHGGVLASLIDLAADYAVAARIGRGRRQSTCASTIIAQQCRGVSSRARRWSSSAAR